MARARMWSLRRAALDHVCREGEGCSGEPDERGAAAVQLLGRDPNSLADRIRIVRDLLRRHARDAAHIVGRAHGVREDGAAPRLDLDLDPGDLQRNDDVAEEHRRVDVVAAHGLQGDLRGEIGGEARVEHARADAQLAVLGQRPTGLAHEPARAATRGDRLRARTGAEHRGPWPHHPISERACS